MQEIFYEETTALVDEKKAKRRYNVYRVTSIVSYVIAALLFFIMLFSSLENVLAFILFAVIPPALMLALGIVAGRLKFRTYVEYDYTFVSGSLRIAKVFYHVKRKPIVKFDVSDIFQLGKICSESYNKLANAPDIKREIYTSNEEPAENKDYYYLAVNLKDGKKLMVLECTEELLVNILKFANRGIVEKNFK